MSTEPTPVKPQIAALRRAMIERGFVDEKGDLDDAKLAAASGVHRSLCGRYVRGETDIGAKNAPALARALGVDATVLVWGRTPEEMRAEDADDDSAPPAPGTEAA